MTSFIKTLNKELEQSAILDPSFWITLYIQLFREGAGGGVGVGEVWVLKSPLVWSEEG